FLIGRLLAFEDIQGYVCGLGITREISQKAGWITVQTPLRTMDDVDTIELGDILIEQGTYRDVMI
ncbi:MAG: hypothetical protein ACM3PY_21635, partial [Omnitrophica WOR_2 bacterium]